MMRPILWTIAVLTVASMGAEWWLHRKVGQLVDSEVERLAKVTTVKTSMIEIKSLNPDTHNLVFTKPASDAGWNTILCHNMRVEVSGIVEGKPDAGMSGEIWWRCTR